MKVWSTEHIYEHPWQTVVNAAYRKYPNPMNGSVTGMDIVQQNVENGVLKTERILQSQFHVPAWAARLTGFSGVQYSREYTEIDPTRRQMVLNTRNLNCSSFLHVDERLIYSPSQSDPSKTQLKQEVAVSVNLPAFTDSCEKMFLNTYANNAMKGRNGLEWVIDQLKREYNEISSKVSSEVHGFSSKFLNSKANTSR
ncbi:PRELI-like family domain-containing protein [Ditylenchus destructor]|nr:PRELI-like family domain-containing protein [Ditylenchus destructor]